MKASNFAKKISKHLRRIENNHLPRIFYDINPKEDDGVD
jgi:hypothetical protein